MNLEFAELRAEGIAELARLSGGQWTDYNVHDPGITILELVVYALTDLGYRAGFPMEDLLADEGADPYDSLFPPEDILPAEPVTAADLRRVAIDVPGVLNAWIEPWVEGDVPLHHDVDSRELGMQADPPATEPVTLRGLSRVLVELAGTAADASAVEAEVARRIFRHRPIGEDFEVIVLKRQPVRVRTRLEIDAVADPDLLLMDVHAALDAAISPPLPAISRREAASAGRPLDEIMDGPLLDVGYVAPDSLARTARTTEIHTSDLVHALMSVAGVRAVVSMSLASGDVWHPWSIPIEDGHTAMFVAETSEVVLTRGGLEAKGRRGSTPASSAVAVGARPTAEPPFPLPKGRDRAIGNYSSFQLDFPAAYGIGELGLPEAASPARHAQALQLKAYLLFFDQVVADLFAQLAHTKDLLAFDPASPATYFHQEVADTGLGLDRVRGPGDGGAAGVDSPRRRDRFLNHLLARFAEEFFDRSLVALDSGDSERLIAEKESFLRRYARVSAARGTAADDLAPPGPGNESGLEERVRLKLGFDADAGERLLLVEHILLRPLKEDELQGMAFLTGAARPDPFSHQVSFVFRTSGRLAIDAFRELAARTAREETPAHLLAYVHWLGPTEWDVFSGAFDDWRRRRRAALRARYGMSEDDE